MPKVWPPQCCVPAFVHAALVELGVECGYPETIPRILGVRVLPGQENPFELEHADSIHPPGIRGVDAEREVNRMCAEMELPLRLRRVPFNTIYAELWEEVLDAALSDGAIVGLGVEYNLLMGRAKTQRSAQHLLRVLRHEGQSLILSDDSGETVPATIAVDVEQARASVISIGDGLWIINDRSRMNFPHTLSWEA